MAGGVSGYAAISARVRILYSALLGRDGLTTLSEAGDLRALVELLRSTAYGRTLDGLKDKPLAPRSAEAELKHRIAEICRTVIQTAPDNARRILAQYYRHHEVNNLKALLRALAIGASADGEGSLWNRVRDLLFPLGTGTVLPAEAIVHAGSIAAAVELLRGTPYYEILSGAMKRYSSEQSLFPLEVALDLHYWRQLWQETRKLAGQDQVHATRVVGSLLDMNNLMWAIRYRVYQHLSEEELINYTLPFGYRVHDEDIRSLAAGADIGSVIGRLYPDIADVASLLEEPKTGLPALEMGLKRHVARQCLAEFVGNPFHVGIALAYMVLLDLEVQDLTVLIEAKASRLPLDKVNPYLTWGLAVKI